MRNTQTKVNPIVYKGGYKYQLAKPTSVQTSIFPNSDDVHNMYCSLDRFGLLTVNPGYAWDGPSGPTFDTGNFMRGSLFHDVLYQFMREERLPEGARKAADQLLRQICIEDGMSRLRGSWVYLGVRWFASGAAKAGKMKKLLLAPNDEQRHSSIVP